MRFKDFLTEKSAAQQAAIAISKKEKGEEPKNEDAEEKARLALKHTQEKERLAQKHAREKEAVASEEFDFDEAFEEASHQFNESILGDARTILYREKLQRLGYARQVIEDELEERSNKNTYNMKGKHKVTLTKSGPSIKPSWHLEVDGKDMGSFKSEKDAMNHYARNFREEIEEELDEAIDYFKVSKELSDYAKKHGGMDKREFEKAAAYVREIGKNSAVSVQDKAGKGLNDLFRGADTDVRDRLQMILTKGGFKVKSGYVMREDLDEGKWFVRQSAKPNKTGTYQGKKYDDGKKAIAQARKDWKLTPDEHMSAKMMKEDELDENKLKDGDKVKTPQGTVEIKARDTSAMRGKQDKFSLVLHMKNGKKASMGSHPSPTASAVTNIAKRFDKGVPSYMAGLNKESVEEKRDAGKSATGYDIYHDTYSAAMQHAYAHAKKKHGVTVSPDEIDSKVASGPRKPSNGKTVSHILGTDKKQNLHVQVYNTGRKYELNMYVESVDQLEENAVELARDVVKNKSAKKGLDMQTANAILTVYDKVNTTNKRKMETMPLDKLANAVWKIVG